MQLIEVDERVEEASGRVGCEKEGDGEGGIVALQTLVEAVDLRNGGHDEEDDDDPW